MKHKVNNTGTGFILLSAVTAVGTASGAVWSAMGMFTGSPLIHQYFRDAETNGLSQIFAHTALSALLFLMAVFLSGTSALGQPSSLILLFYRGFGTGVSAAMLYSEMGLKAFTAVVLLLLPKALCMLITAIIAVREALRSSCGLACCMTGADSYGNHSGSLRLYAVRFIVLAFISIAVSAADTVMLSLFSSIISK